MSEEREVYWFAGAMFGGRSDQTEKFLREGVWENNYEDRFLEVVRSMRPGDRIAIKAAYTRKNGLPFDNRGEMVSVMSIKATGTVLDNPGDGRHVQVDWDPQSDPREWYFFTNRTTVWGVEPSDWMRKALIRFAFAGEQQPIERFLEEPHWRQRYRPNTDQFAWTEFYQEFADKLLKYKSDRVSLLEKVYSLADGVSHLKDKFADGSSGNLRDICPFTVFGLFNRGITNENRIRIAKSLKSAFGISREVPAKFDGIPVLDNRRSWFFGYEHERKPEDIQALWNVFEQVLELSDSDDAELEDQFTRAYDKARMVKGVNWNLTMGCYWIRPWAFPTLDKNTRGYLRNELDLNIGDVAPTGSQYVHYADLLSGRFKDPDCPVHSFPELSQVAWLTSDEEPAVGERDEEQREAASATEEDLEVGQLYTVDDIANEGCLLAVEDIESILANLKTKKNLILQGPPGTGKTWLAKRLAFALVGRKDVRRVRPLQFHPNLSYEDFVRGWRPAGNGQLQLCDGPLMEAVSDARASLTTPLVLVIEEINRGNPAQILGEMLTLLEADKRSPEHALALSYRMSPDERVHIPSNLFLIGTMNIADRSLAIVDFALRRRFAFIDLVPQFGTSWRNWVAKECGLGADVARTMEALMSELNDTIASDPTLGAPYRVGHSYLTPLAGVVIDDPVKWFLQVVRTEIGPLLDEYWFDAPEKAERAKDRLMQGIGS